MFGPTSAGVRTRRGRASAQSDQGYYYVVLAAAVICSILVVAIIRGRLGRLLRGLPRLAARARHRGRHHQRHPRPRVLHLRVPRRDLRCAVRGLRRARSTGRRSRRSTRSRSWRWSSSWSVARRGTRSPPRRSSADPGLHRHRQHPGLPPDLLRPCRGLRRSPRRAADDSHWLRNVLDAVGGRRRKRRCRRPSSSDRLPDGREPRRPEAPVTAARGGAQVGARRPDGDRHAGGASTDRAEISRASRSSTSPSASAASSRSTA